MPWAVALSALRAIYIFLFRLTFQKREARRAHTATAQGIALGRISMLTQPERLQEDMHKINIYIIWVMTRPWAMG